MKRVLTPFTILSSMLFGGFTKGSTTTHPLAHSSAERYKPRYFEDTIYMDVESVKQLTTYDAMYLPVGEVLMVRSANVPEMEDHFAVITGPIEIKEHGVRPRTSSIATSPNGIQLLDLFEPKNGVTLLQLKPYLRDKFHDFHGVVINGKEFVCLKPFE